MAKRKTPKKASARKPRPASPKAKARAPVKTPTPEAEPAVNLFPKIAHLKKRAFLQAFTTVGMVGRAAEAAGISPRTHHLWVKDDEDYAEAFRDATALASEILEAEAIRRAIHGVDEPVFYQGSPCGTVRKYSDTLLIFLMKGANPAKYRERLDVTSGDKPVKLYATLSPEEI